MSTPAQTVNTKKSLRREVGYASLAEVLIDARRLVAAESAGTLRPTGNWSLGQAFGHLAAWIDFAYDGYPGRLPWFVRLLGPLMKNRMLHRSASPGLRIPGAPGGTHATEPLSTPEGYQRLERAIGRAMAQAPSRPNPLLGPLSHEEFMLLHRRHAELHLSFFWIA